MRFFLLSRKGPTAGYAGSDASGDTSSAVRRSAQEPIKETSQNQRGSAGILSVQGPFRERRMFKLGLEER